MNDFPLNVPELMRQYGLRADKRLGQNFLVDQAALNKVVEAANIEASDTVLEIGPGLGSLTYLLASKARRVVAVELDQRLIPVLHQVLDPFQNVEVILGDILQINLNKVMQTSGYLVVANIPYYITSNLIRQLLETQTSPRRMILTVQKEVAERICAQPGEMSLLAISVQVYGQPVVAATISAGSFYPSPKVDSAVVRVDLYPEPKIDPGLLKTFFKLAKAGFSQKRKTLKNALSGGMHWLPNDTEWVLEMAEIDPRRRAETLALDEWSNLAQQARIRMDENQIK